MKNNSKIEKTNNRMKEILYIEMIHQQMATFMDIDNLIKTGSRKILVQNQQTT
ncbi:MAG: hypothetical protein ACJA1A_003653 [Saprospiraceae bacterium]|jgi:hypothetical protein|tara:strand:+ start:357 stop:515 length:159 start_codon:yes stop_codon:yes gene_type:complete